MSTRIAKPTGSLAAGADLRLKEWAFGKLSSGLPIACSVLGERADFVLGLSLIHISEPTRPY